MRQEYDVVIMGGGPAGSTLGALLRRKSSLSVALFDSAVFPREHIGESFAHPVIPALEESGALAKVLAADCWIKKYGGIFNWDENRPSVTYFDHPNFLADGIHRWAIHTDRAEFDHILLQHAADCGVEVFEGTPLTRFRTEGGGAVLTLQDGREVRARLFVDASGRQDSLATNKKRTWLSGYRNIAIWNHYYHCQPAHELAGDWNIFRENHVSPIACFAFEDGWVWYIPIRKQIDGQRQYVHSVGLVTDPSILKQPGKDYTDPDFFLARLKQVPMLRDLIQDAVRTDEKMLTITNYSMINERFCNYDEKWILLGDASYFVDPLFSSGVAFATNQAMAVALLIRSTLEGSLTERDARDMWRDYDAEWHVMAETFALSIDQWYHAIAKNHPDSVYWNSRGRNRVDLGIRESTFQALVDTAITPDLLQILTKGSLDAKDLHQDGPFLAAQGIVADRQPADSELLALAPGVAVRESLSVDVPGFKAAIPPMEIPEQLKTAIGEYWLNPIANGHKVPSPLDAPLRCHRIFFAGQPDGEQLRIVDERDGGLALIALLTKAPVTYGELKRVLSPPQIMLLRKLMLANMVVVQDARGAMAEAQTASYA